MIAKLRHLPVQRTNVLSSVGIDIAIAAVCDGSQVMKTAPADLRRRLFITIRGEEALDYGGVSKLVS